MTPSSPAVGRVIRSLRERSGLPLARVAQASGLSANELDGIESGRARPSIAVLDRVARAMGSKIVDLVRSAENSGSVDGAPPRAQSLGGLSEIAQAIVDLSGKVGSKIDAVESAAVIHAMNVCHGNQSAAARLLGMERKAFVRRLHRAQRRRT